MGHKCPNFYYFWFQLISQQPNSMNNLKASSMKRIGFLVTYVFIVLIGFTQPTYPVPAFDNVPYYYDESTNALIELEHAQYHVQGKANGFTGTKSMVVIPGISASLRLNETQPMQFIIRFDDAKALPDMLLEVAKLDLNVKHQEREFVIRTTGMGHSETHETNLRLKFKPIGTGLYLVTFAQPLSPGEYAFSAEKTRQAFTFGVGAAKTASELQEEKPRPHDPLAEAIYKKLQEKKNKPATQSTPSTPIPTSSIADELTKLKKLLDEGIITQAEFDTQKHKLLSK